MCFASLVSTNLLRRMKLYAVGFADAINLMFGFVFFAFKFVDGYRTQK